MPRQDEVILVAIQVRADGREEAQEIVMEALSGDHVSVEEGDFRILAHPLVECWWIAEDDRIDRSDCDSAVFVDPGRQARASKVLYDLELTQDWNIVPADRKNIWRTASDRA